MVFKNVQMAATVFNLKRRFLQLSMQKKVPTLSGRVYR